MSEFVHPTTGEVLTLRELRGRLDDVEHDLAPLFRERNALRQMYAEGSEPAAIPRPRDRTDKQERVTRCPRCGTRIPKELS